MARIDAIFMELGRQLGVNKLEARAFSPLQLRFSDDSVLTLESARDGLMVSWQVRPIDPLVTAERLLKTANLRRETMPTQIGLIDDDALIVATRIPWPTVTLASVTQAVGALRARVFDEQERRR